MKKQKRICITRNGYATVQADTDQEALNKAKSLTESDFDWEPVDENMIEDAATVVETICE